MNKIIQTGWKNIQ